ESNQQWLQVGALLGTNEDATIWVDFRECMSHCKLSQDCLLLREDYMECLHHNKEVFLLIPDP
ncbi:hypothetical protein GIB67_039434, partial [Kingdonia uniflora]